MLKREWWRFFDEEPNQEDDLQFMIGIMPTIQKIVTAVRNMGIANSIALKAADVRMKLVPKVRLIFHSGRPGEERVVLHPTFARSVCRSIMRDGQHGIAGIGKFVRQYPRDGSAAPRLEFRHCHLDAGDQQSRGG